MTHMVTRCPKCATAFRITTTQLESAKGSVRCGSCLHIFKAQDDLISAVPISKEKETEKESEKESAAITWSTSAAESINKPKAKETNATELNFGNISLGEATSPKAKSSLDFADDILISDDMDELSVDPSSYEFEGYLDMDLRPTQTKSLFERDLGFKPEKISEEVDESWAEALLYDDQDLSSNGKPTTPVDIPEPVAKQHPHQDLGSAIMERYDVAIPDVSEYSRINDEFSNLYKNPTFNIVNDAAAELPEPPVPDKVAFTAIPEQELEPELTPTTTFGTGFFRHRDEQDLAHPLKHPLKSQPAMHAQQESRATLLMNIPPSPIELTAQRILSWSQKTHWGSLTLLAGIILIGQIAYFKFDQLSLIEPYRTAYVWACPIFNCKLPGLKDASKIIPYQLILRNHPTAKNALLLDLMIRNDAEFEQPFPDLVLAFTTMDEKPVASRRFKAKEYLNGELAGKQIMPSKQPVHITLELSDPGAEAVNYHMTIAP